MKAIVLIIALIGALVSIYFLYKYRQKTKETIDEEILQTGKKLKDSEKKTDEGLEKLGLDPKEVREAAGEKKPCAYEPPCESDKFFLNADGCCELKPEKTLTKDQQKLEMAKSITKSLVTDMVIGEMAEFAVEKSIEWGTKASAKLGAKLASKKMFSKGLGKAGKKLAGEAFKKVGKSLAGTAMKLVSPGFAFEAVSMALDLLDPAGYGAFKSNKSQKQERNAIEVSFEKAIKEEGMSYPMAYPLQLVFPDEMNAVNGTLVSVFLKDILDDIKKNDEEAFTRIVTTIQEGGDLSDADSDIIGDGLVKFMENNPEKRDKQIYEGLKKSLPADKKDLIGYYPKISTKDRQGVTLNQKGVDWWNNQNRMSWIKGAKDAPPFVAVFTKEYRILDTKNPGKKTKPNTIEKKLPSQVALAFPFIDLFNSCEGVLKSGSVVKKLKTNVKPYDYGVRFNSNTALCNFTNDWCTRMGLNYKKKAPTDCYQPVGSKIVGTLLGDTVAKGATQAINTWARSYGRGSKMPICKKGYEKKGLLCYPKCKKGYKSRALECEGKCPKGSKNTGLTCLQGTKAYVKMRLGGCKKSSCKKGYERKLKTKLGCTCVKPCMKGFKRRSNAAGSAFCDKKRPRYTRIGKEKSATGCKSGYEFNKPSAATIAAISASTAGAAVFTGAATALPLCYKKCKKKNFYGAGPRCFPCSGIEKGKEKKLCIKMRNGKETSKVLSKIRKKSDAMIMGATYNADTDKYYFFKNDQYWSDPKGKKLPSGPKSAQSAWKIDNVDAVTYNADTDKYYFFKDGKYWEKPKGKSIESKGSVTKAWGINPPGKNNFDDVIYNADTDKYYFFKDGDYWSKPEGKKASGKKSMKKDWGIDNIDAGIYNADTNKYYFFKDGQYWEKPSGKKINKKGDTEKTWKINF